MLLTNIFKSYNLAEISMKQLNGQFVISILVMAFLVLNPGFVVCNCQAGHVNLEPLMHDCHHDHTHLDIGSDFQNHQHHGPIASDTGFGNSGNGGCDYCVDVPLKGADILPVRSLNYSINFVVLAEFLLLDTSAGILSTFDIDSQPVSSFYAPLCAIILRN